jgi:hypothetical protein
VSEQPDVDPDGTGLRDHASGGLAPEQSDAAITDELPDAESNREDPGLPLEPERDSDTTPP